jgi:hypothetical protein
MRLFLLIRKQLSYHFGDLVLLLGLLRIAEKIRKHFVFDQLCEGTGGGDYSLIQDNDMGV